MISEAVLKALKGFVPEENIHVQEPMAAHTTFRVGGPADCFIEIETPEQLSRIQKYLRIVEIPFFVVGNGSNLLVSDKGYKGIVLQVGKKMSHITVAGDKIYAQAGALLSQVAQAALKAGLQGFEFAAGIPGTAGGAVVMNAGAYGGEMCQVVTQVSVVNKDGEQIVLDNESMEFGYRTSALKNHPFVVTEVVYQLQKGDREEIKAKLDELSAKRREKQPLEYPSAGSTFKRPEGHFAGQLIMEAGLRGFRIGGAAVSEKHCGFVVNTGMATADEVMQVICHVQRTVEEKFRVSLEPEVIFLGKF